MAGTLRITAAALVALLQLFAAAAGAARVDPRAESEERTNAAYGQLPLAFVANAGQANARVRYEARAAGASFYFARTKAVFAFARGEDGVALELSFVGGNRSAVIEGVGLQPGTRNYLIGNDPTKWHTGLRSYRDVVYREVWPGIDVAFRGDGSKLKYEFHLAPGADVSDIRLRYRGADRLSIGRTKELRIHTGLGVLRDSKPVTYQVVGGARVPIESSYALASTRSAYGFSVEAYDRSRPLVIDPGLAYSTLLGSSFSDIGHAIAVDGDGNAYVTGFAGASNFPTSLGAFDTSHNGGNDVFVTKLNASGSALVYSTFLGGALNDDANGIAVDGAGQAVVTGSTNSSNFPTANAFDASHNGTNDGFVAKLDAMGAGLVYSTYVGGSLADWGNGIALDAGGNALVAGQTESANFPVSAGALDTALGGGGDAFVTKLGPGGSVLYSTFLGGLSGGEAGNGIAVDSGGNAYVTGFAGLGFPVTAGAFDPGYNEGGDAYVAKLDASGSTLIYSTYLGTGGSDHGNGIAVDAAGNAHVAGRTNASTFPTTAGAFDRTYNGGFDDAFVTKLDGDGSALLYSTYLGSGATDWARAIAVDPSGVAQVTGFTDGSNFPTTAGAFDTTFNGLSDAYITRLNAEGSALVDSTFLGGTGLDQAYGIAVDANGNAYVTGWTLADFPTTAGAFDRSGNGNHDVFVTKLATATPNQPPVVDAGPDASIWEGQTFASTGSFTDTGSSSWTATVDYGDGSGVQSLALSGNTFALTHVYDDNGAYTVTVSVTDDQGATGSDTAVVTVANVAPTASFVAETPIFEGGSSGVSLSEPFDPSGADTAAGFRYAFACDGADGSLASSYAAAGTDASASCSFADDGTYPVKGRILDKDDGATTYDAGVVVQNVAPQVGTIVAPADPVSVGTVVDASAPFTDPGTLDTHATVVDWGDGATSLGTVTEANGSGSAAGSHVYTTPGVYTVLITVTDDDGGAGQSLYQYVVVYDPNGPSVRGRGTILSSPGAYVADPSITGEAVFGFQSGYKRGATVPSGHTRFRFQLAGFTFVSRDYDWLVAAGARAQFKGTGEVNGSGSYGFLLTAVDGDVSGGGGADRFRIKIWEKTTGDVVYDNQLGSPGDADPQVLLDGSIVIA